MKISADGDQQDAINKIQEYKTKMEAKDNIRNAEETVESFRRKMVLKGEWTEENSMSKIQDMFDDI